MSIELWRNNWVRNSETHWYDWFPTLINLLWTASLEANANSIKTFMIYCVTTEIKPIREEWKVVENTLMRKIFPNYGNSTKTLKISVGNCSEANGVNICKWSIFLGGSANLVVHFRPRNILRNKMRFGITAFLWLIGGEMTELEYVAVLHKVQINSS